MAVSPCTTRLFYIKNKGHRVIWVFKVSGIKKLGVVTLLQHVYFLYSIHGTICIFTDEFIYIYMYTHTMNRPMAPYRNGFLQFFQPPKKSTNRPRSDQPTTFNQDQRPTTEYDQLRKFIEVRGPMAGLTT